MGDKAPAPGGAFDHAGGPAGLLAAAAAVLRCEVEAAGALWSRGSLFRELDAEEDAGALLLERLVWLRLLQWLGALDLGLGSASSSAAAPS